LGPAGESVRQAAGKAAERVKDAAGKAGERLKSAAEERGLTRIIVKSGLRSTLQAKKQVVLEVAPYWLSEIEKEGRSIADRERSWRMVVPLQPRNLSPINGTRAPERHRCSLDSMLVLYCVPCLPRRRTGR
jgi:hypothetical protein